MKFKKKVNRKAEIATSALPDIVFLLLFFFMVSATIRPREELIAAKIPKAKAITKVDRKELLSELFVGIPKDSFYGTEPRISVDDQFITLDQVAQWALQQKEALPESLKDQMIVVLKADVHVKMGLISDIEEELKKVNARKLVFRTTEKLM